MTKRSSLELAVCVAGIYVCFLSWGVLQERVTTRRYEHPETGEPQRFKHFVFLNVVQSAIASAVALLYLATTSLKGLAWPSTALRNKFFQLSLVSVCAAPFGYASLGYIDYPTMILGKTGKLVPVMLMNILLYRKSFPWQKYLVVALITAGMTLFMLMNPKGHKSDKNANIPLAGKLWGITLLSINLLLDGVTNSTQDEIFRTFRNVNGFLMMFYMNLFSSGIMLLFLGFSDPFIGEFSGAIAFTRMHPQVLFDILLFGLCGALGQCFIFHTIERFGAMILVTITVTRKMGSILMSVFLYNHSLALGQWAAVLLVFSGIFVESFAKGKSHGPSSDAKKDGNAGSVDEKVALLKEDEDRMGMNKDDGVDVLNDTRSNGARKRKGKK
ncbi:UDP-galactose transporter [Chytriomyces hyalinus]|nr:UDP-galactose transporter [Chytriomyces hyalinus]